ncbi:MAG: pilus assembly protein [Sphingomonadaceae bacterium]
MRGLCLIILLMLPLAAAAVPPILAIDSEPLAAACPLAGGPDAAVVRGALVLQAASGGAMAAFQASTDTADWSGHLERLALVPAGDGSISTSTPAWDAGAILTAGNPAPAQRKIYTSISQADGQFRTVPFTWEALSDAQRAALDLMPPAVAGGRPRSDHLGAQRLDYLRGERALEGVLFRRRRSLLGDAVHATPLLAGAPAALYLGTNDGMLHAFDAATGVEWFAYVPDAIFAKLNLLTSADYQHQAYVHGPAETGLLQLGTEKTTVLVSAMGGGAQGVFALDISAPAQFGSGRGALWEFTDRDDPMMGNVTTVPQVARFRVRKGADGLRDFAVVASGLNNYVSDGHRSSAGNGALFLLALDKPADQPWQLNRNYYRLVVPISEPSLANGLSAPALVADRDGTIRYGYAGDLQGNLWRFDFAGSPPWDAGSRSLLFVARDLQGTRQPISQQPRVVYASEGGYLILFGTGRMITRADRAAASYATQSYYGILDTLGELPIASRRDLTPRVLSGDSTLSLRGAPIEAGSRGWYLDFLNSAHTGERSVASGVLVDGQLLFNTLLPGRDACAAPAARSYALNALTGLASERGYAAVDGVINDSVPFVGIPLTSYAATPLVLPLAMPAPEQSRAASGKMRRERPYVLAQAPAGGERIRSSGHMVGVLHAGRLSWREVANWRALHEAATAPP